MQGQTSSLYRASLEMNESLNRKAKHKRMVSFEFFSELEHQHKLRRLFKLHRPIGIVLVMRSGRLALIQLWNLHPLNLNHKSTRQYNKEVPWDSALWTKVWQSVRCANFEQDKISVSMGRAPPGENQKFL